MEGLLWMKHYKTDALLFKAFCDESRLQILDLIRGEETCSCVILKDLTISQSTLSHHMKILVDSGIVSARKDGKNTMYVLNYNAYEQAKQILYDIFCTGIEKSKPTTTCK